MEELRERLSEHMHVLCDQIGERHLGSEGEAKAADYIQHSFESSGYRVFREGFDAPGWTYGEYSLSIAETGQALPCFPCYYSQPCDVTGKLLIVDQEDLENLDVKGRICFVPKRSSTKGVEKRNELAERLDEMGAAALIVVSRLHHAVDTKIVRTPKLKRLGVMCIAGETVWEIGRNIESDFGVKIVAKNFSTRSSNIVARVKGDSGKKAIIGAHYDTAPGIAGASDNASGTAMVLELARLLKGKTNGYSLDFVVFGAEEYGGKGALGSFEYARQHHAELEHISWMCNTDGVGTFLGQEGVYVARSWQMRDCVERTVKPYGLTTEDALLGGDDAIFHHNAIPTVRFFNPSCMGEVHSPRDDLRIISIDGLTNVCEAAYAVASQLLKEF